MRVTIVSKGNVIYEIRRLAEELTHRGNSVQIINPLFSLQDVFRDEWWRTYTDTDVLYYRTGLGDAPRTELTRRLLDTNVRCINKVAIDHHLLSNKVYQAIQVLRAGNVPVPKTYFGRGHIYAELVKSLGQKFVLKAAQGIQGKKVTLITNEQEYNDSVQQLSGDILMQEFIPNTGDFRVFIIGGVTQAIFKRIPKDGDFRANMSQGGRGEIVTDVRLRTLLSQYAESVATLIGLDVAGIDLMQHSITGELYFIESNVNPGWKGLDETLGTNMAATLADFILAQ